MAAGASSEAAKGKSSSKAPGPALQKGSTKSAKAAKSAKQAGDQPVAVQQKAPADGHVHQTANLLASQEACSNGSLQPATA